MMSELNITLAQAPTPEIRDLVAAHVAFCDETSPPDSCHRLPEEALFAPDVCLWTAHDGDRLLGMGALKALSPKAGEIKSMHCRTEARGRGVAAQLLGTIVSAALSRGYTDLWLETGTHPAFTPARRLYEKFGFSECPPFGSYIFDPHSLFMTKAPEVPK